MESEAILLPWYVRDRIFSRVAPAFGAFLASPSEPPERLAAGPEEPPAGCYPLTFWADGQPVASTWLAPETAKHIQRSPFLASEVELVLVATLPIRFPMWVQVHVAAVATSAEQMWSLLEIGHRKRKPAPLRHVAWGRPGLLLGHHWGRLPGELARFDPEDRESLGALVRHCNQMFDRILYGDDAACAIRFLESIPGLRGERPDPVC